MDGIDTEIKPSPEARRIFGRLVANAHCCHLDLAGSLKTAIDLRRAGHDQNAQTTAVRELRAEGWMQPAEDGGWRLLS